MFVGLISLILVEMASSSPPPLSIYCINLDHRTDRWAHIQSAIRNTPIEHFVTRFPAISHLGGVNGCRESHFAVIRKAKLLGLPWVGIMEDDCAFYPHFSDMLPTVLDKLWLHRTKWDIFNSGPINIKSLFRIDAPLVRVDTCACTQFIIINGSAYDQILDSYKDGVSEAGVDLYYRDLCAGRIVTCSPPLTYQINSPSDVQHGYTIGDTDEFQKAYQFLSIFARR
jgi:hypothetical protein